MGPPPTKRANYGDTGSDFNPQTPLLHSPYLEEIGSVGTPHTPYHTQVASIDSGIGSVPSPHLYPGTPYSAGIPSVGRTAAYNRAYATWRRLKCNLYGKIMNLLTDEAGRITSTRLGKDSLISFHMQHFTL